MLSNRGVGEDSSSPLDSKEIQTIHSRGSQSWILIGKTDAEAEAPMRWLLDVKNWLIWKDPDAGNDWRQEKGMTEDEMVGWHHWLNGREFEQVPGAGDGQGSRVHCSPLGHKESDTTERLNWLNLGSWRRKRKAKIFWRNNSWKIVKCVDPKSSNNPKFKK